MFAGRPEESGFTLVEMLVALSIFSLAALALLKLGGTSAANGAVLEEQALAQIVARNLAVEALSDPRPPAFGDILGEALNANRRWRWSRRTVRSPESRIQQIEIRVTGSRAAAQLTVFRRAGA